MTRMNDRMNDRRITRWAQQLFGSTRATGPVGRERGFTGAAGDIVVGPQYKISEHWDGAPHARKHLKATSDQLQYVVKHAYSAASGRGDQAMLDMLDRLHKNLADQMLIAADQVRRALADRGYASDFNLE